MYTACFATVRTIVGSSAVSCMLSGRKAEKTNTISGVKSVLPKLSSDRKNRNRLWKK